MKARIRNAGLGLAFAIIAALGAMTYIRLAPSDPAEWHIALPTGTRGLEGSDCTAGISPATGGARSACSVPGTAPEVLTRLSAIALATPRTRLLAGSPDEGRLTWETRSLIWGFPDYTTVQAETRGASTRLDILARQRFGEADFGANAARLRDWLSKL